MITVFVPVCPSWAKSPLWLTVRFTVRFEVGAGLTVTVKSAGSPSVTADVGGAMVTVGRQFGRFLTCSGSMTSFLYKLPGKQVRLLLPPK